MIECPRCQQKFGSNTEFMIHNTLGRCTASQEAPPAVTTYPRYEEIRGILNRKTVGQDCSEDESAALKTWVKETTLVVGNGTIELDEEIQSLFPLEWMEAQEEIEQKFGGYE